MGPAAEVPGLAVAEDCRHRGVGRRLLQQALTSTDLVGAIARTDEDAVGFYRSCGFATERTVVSYPDGEAVRYTCSWTKVGTDGKDR